MGQYSQWLHYREVEQLLQAQLEPLNQRLAQLQARAQQLREYLRPAQEVQSSEHPSDPGRSTADALTGNPIISALALDLRRKPAPPESLLAAQKPLNGAAASPANGSAAAGVKPSKGSPETMSSALFAWSNLPNLGLQEGLLASAMANYPTPSTPAQQPPPSSPHADLELLPEDMLAFFEQHSPTDPQIELPHWLRPIADAASAHNSDAPVDQESIRTNRLVQRWIERWGRQTAAPSPGQAEGENQS